jgi:hypothetical protein
MTVFNRSSNRFLAFRTLISSKKYILFVLVSVVVRSLLIGQNDNFEIKIPFNFCDNYEVKMKVRANVIYWSLNPNNNISKVEGGIYYSLFGSKSACALDDPSSQFCQVIAAETGQNYFPEVEDLSQYYGFRLISQKSDVIVIDGKNATHNLLIYCYESHPLVSPKGVEEDKTKINHIRAGYREQFEFKIPGLADEYAHCYNKFYIDSYGEFDVDGDNASQEFKQIISKMQNETWKLINTMHFEYSSSGSNSSPTNTQTPPESNLPDTTSAPLENIPWTIIIGSISAVVIATIIRRLLKKKKPKAEVAAEKTAEEEAEAVHYILQLNRDSFRLKINQPEILEIQVWKITTRGKSKIQAQVSIENPEKNLTIRSRNTGSGLIADLCLDKPPASSNFELTVLATAEGIPIQKSVSITTSDKMEIIIETIPNNRRTLRPDTKKVLTCCAKVVDENGKPLIDLTKKLKFKPQSKWIDLSDPVMDGDHIAINVGASNPDQNSVRSNIPHDITLSVILDAIKEKAPPLQSDLVIVLQDCLLDTDIERCSFPVAEHQTEISFKAFIQNCDSEEKWDFKAEYRRGTDPLEKPLSEISILKTSDTEASITLKGPLTVPEADEASITEKLVIFACQSDETPLERHLPVTVSQVGLFITGHLNEKKELSYLADKPFETDIEFVLYQLDKETNKVIVDQEGLKRLTFELKNEEKDIRNFAQVLKPVFTFKDLVGNIPYGRYKYSSTGEMPGFGDVFTLTYIVHAPCDGDENSAQFSQELKVLVKTAGIGEGFPDWEKAYRDCKRIIDIYVPAGNLRSQLSELLEQKKMMLDVEGLIYLRHEIWQKAYNLILKEGEAYLQEAEWNDKVMSLLDWTKWAGDIAFKVLTTYLGPIAGTIAEISKPTIVEAIIAYNEGITFEQLIRKVGKNLLVNTAETGKGKINNMEFIEAKLIKNKVNAWAFFIAVEFAWHYLVKKEDKQTYVDSAKAAGESIRDEVFVPGVIPYANTSIGDLGKQGAGFIKKLALRLSEVRIS